MSIPVRKRKRPGKKRYPNKPLKLRPPRSQWTANIKDMRLARRWRQVDLAKHSGVPLPTIVAIEQGKTHDPKLSTLRRLAKAFKVTLGVLAGDENPLEIVGVSDGEEG